jgi:hypothetical protein
LNAKDLIAGLKERRVYPTTLTCFVVMLFFQITCVGGFNQTTWLGQIKDKFSALLRDECLEGKYLGLAEKIKPVSTDNFAEGSLAFLKSNRAIKATGIDILLEDDPNSYRKYLKLSQSVSLAESIEAELPEIYSVVVPATERI